MGKIIWTRSSLRDLQQIHEYISEDSKFYADRFVKRLVTRVDILEDFPLTGRMIPEMEDETLRELIEGNYRIFYKIEKRKGISILRVHHAAKNIL